MLVLEVNLANSIILSHSWGLGFQLRDPTSSINMRKEIATNPSSKPCKLAHHGQGYLEALKYLCLERYKVQI